MSSDAPPLADNESLVRVDSRAAAALAFVIRHGINELEARALACAQLGDHGPSRLPYEYRDDIGRLRKVLGQIESHATYEPQPEGHPLSLPDGLHVIRSGRPVRLGDVDPIERLLATALRRSSAGHAIGLEIADALAIATKRPLNELINHARNRHLDNGSPEPAPSSNGST